jgi:hypothetical protein
MRISGHRRPSRSKDGKNEDSLSPQKSLASSVPLHGLSALAAVMKNYRAKDVNNPQEGDGGKSRTSLFQRKIHA